LTVTGVAQVPAPLLLPLPPLEPPLLPELPELPELPLDPPLPELPELPLEPPLDDPPSVPLFPPALLPPQASGAEAATESAQTTIRTGRTDITASPRLDPGTGSKDAPRRHAFSHSA
jgi:hypothetical protein